LVKFGQSKSEKEFLFGMDNRVNILYDTPLKELWGLLGTYRLTFKAMGETAARMDLGTNKGKVKNPFNFIDRRIPFGTSRLTPSALYFILKTNFSV